MQVRELIEELLRAPPDAVPVVGGQVIDGVLLRRGTVRGERCPTFSASKNGQQVGLIFLAKTEMANGVVAAAPK